MSPGDAFEALPRDYLEDAREAMLALSRQLFALDERSLVFGAEARVAWLDAAVGLKSLAELRDALLRARDLQELLAGHHECRLGPSIAPDWPKLESPQQHDDHDELLQGAVRLSGELVVALYVIVDRVRAGARRPGEPK